MQNGWHSAGNIFKCISLHEKIWISFKISLKFVLNSPIHKKYTSIGSDNGLVLTRGQAIISNNDGLVPWRIYALLGLNVLTY